MTQFLIFLIIGAVGIAAGYYLALKRKAKMDVLLTKQNEAMKANAQKLREYVHGKALRQAQGENKITNNDVEKLLGVSDATATRYLERLEREGILEQIGRKGQSVYYRPK